MSNDQEVTGVEPLDETETVTEADTVDTVENVANDATEASTEDVVEGNSSGADSGGPRSARPTQKRRRRNPGGKRSTKEAFWVRIAMPDGTSQFFPATDHIGKIMPFSGPKETCAMRVYPEVICFSLLHLTKKATKDLRDKPITMPHAPLSRLARRAEEVAAEPGTIVVEHRREIDGVPTDQTITMSLKVNDAKVATVDSIGPEGDEAFELSGRGERISLFLHSPASGRRIALGYIGHLGRPGTADTLARCAAKILHATAALPEFSILTGIEAADVPAMTGGITVIRPNATHADTHIDVRLFGEIGADGTPPLIGEGQVKLEIDLEHAASSTDRLLFHLTPDDNLKEAWKYYQSVAERWVNGRLAEMMGTELSMIIYDVILGEVTDETVSRLRDHLTNIGAVDFTPNQFRQR